MNLRLVGSYLYRCVWRFFARMPLNAYHLCCICNSRVRRFLPYKNGLSGVPFRMVELAVIGSDVENFECPVCRAHDRERHLFMYLGATGQWQKMSGARILHLAPEQNLQHFIVSSGPAEYVRGDLFPSHSYIEQINLENLKYPDNHFDFVMANHVLEHVNDDAQALREIFRVLAPGGRAILQTPYASGLAETFENPEILSEQARLQAYGQEDHLRLYGCDIKERFEASGLRSEMRTHSDVLSDVQSGKMGVNASEPFFMFLKPKSL